MKITREVTKALCFTANIVTRLFLGKILLKITFLPILVNINFSVLNALKDSTLEVNLRIMYRHICSLKIRSTRGQRNIFFTLFFQILPNVTREKYESLRFKIFLAINLSDELSVHHKFSMTLT